MTRLLLATVALALTSATFAQGRIFRDINTGDSALEVATKLTTYDDVTDVFGEPASASTPEDMTGLLDSGWYFMDIAGIHTQLVFVFYDDKLYRMEINGEDHTANYFDTALRDDINSFSGIVTQAQGSPDITYDVSFIDTRHGYISWTHVWNANDEGTTYHVGISEWESEWSAELIIEWEWLAGQADAAAAAEENEAVNDAAGDF